MANTTISFHCSHTLHFQGGYPTVSLNSYVAPSAYSQSSSKISSKLTNIAARIEAAVACFDANLDPKALLESLHNEKSRLYRLRKKIDTKKLVERCHEIEEKILQMKQSNAFHPISEPSYVQRTAHFLQATAEWLTGKLQFLPAVSAQSFGLQKFAKLHEPELLEIARIDQLLEWEPANGSHYSNRALNYLKIDLSGLALDDALQGALLAPNNHKSHHILAKAYQASGELRLARDAFAKSQQLNPLKTDDDYFLDAIACLNLDETAKAHQQLNHAHKLNPRFYDNLGLFHYYLALTYDASQHKAALSAFHTAFELGFKDPVEETKAHFHLALFLAWSGRVDKAFSHFERAEIRHLLVIKQLPSYNFLKGIFELVKDPDDGYIEAQKYFDNAINQKLNVRRELVDWFIQLQRPDLALSYFQSHMQATHDPSYYYEISNFAFQATNCSASMIAYRRAVLYDASLTLYEINHKLFDIALFMEQQGQQLDFYSLKRHLQVVVGEVEALAVRSPSPDEDFSAGILYLLLGNVKKAEFHLTQAGQKNGFYSHFSKLVPLLVAGKKAEALQAITALIDHFRPRIGAKVKTDTVALYTLAHIYLAAAELHDSLEGAAPVTKTAFAVIKKMLLDEEVDLNSRSFLDGAYAFFESVDGVEARIFWSALFILGIGMLFHSRKGSKNATHVLFVAPLLDQRERPRERRVPKYIPRARTKSPEREDETKKLQKKIEQFQNEVSQLFLKSEVGLEITAVQRDNFSVKVLIDCQIPKYRLFLENEKSKYLDLFSKLFGKVVSSRTFTDEKIYRWVFEINLEENERDLVGGVEAVKRIETEVKKAFSGHAAALQKGEWDEMMQRLTEVSQSKQWEKALSAFFAPIGSVSLDLQDRQLQVFVTPQSHLFEHCMAAGTLQRFIDSIDRQAGVTLEVYYDFVRNGIVVNIPKNVECSHTLVLVDLDLPEDIQEPLVTLATLPQPFVAKKERPSSSSSSGISVGYAAPRGPSTQEIWKMIYARRDKDAKRIEELSKLINLLGRETSFYVQKSVAIRFLEIYKRLTFWKLRPQEKMDAILVRNSLIHHEWLVKEDEFIQLTSSMHAVAEKYQGPYLIHDAIMVEYSLHLKKLEFLQELQEQTRFYPEAGSEFEKQSINKIKECCKKFLDIETDAFSKEGLHAYRCGLILTIRELLQANNISLETKNKIEDELRARKVLISREFYPGKKEIIEKNELTNLGDRLAHGDVSVDIDDIEMRQIVRSLPVFVDVLSCF